MAFGLERLVDPPPDAVEQGRLVAGRHSDPPVEFGQVPEELRETVAGKLFEHAVREPRGRALRREAACSEDVVRQHVRHNANRVTLANQQADLFELAQRPSDLDRLGIEEDCHPVMERAGDGRDRSDGRGQLQQPTP